MSRFVRRSAPYQDPHLHAAAVHGKVDYVMSQDKGFARFADNDDTPYEVYTADDFFVLVNDSAPAIVREAIAAELRFHYRRGDTNLPRMLKQLGADQSGDRPVEHANDGYRRNTESRTPACRFLRRSR